MPKTSSPSPERVGLKALAAAEKVLLERFGKSKPSAYSYKAHHEIVTVADRAANRAILSVFKKETPDYDVLSEEGAARTKSDWCWIVDPLDGTNNYAAQLPLWGISIALEHNGRVVLGLISLPYLGERFIARENGGAWHIEKGRKPERVHTAKTKKLEDALGLLCYGYQETHKKTALRLEPRLVIRSRTTRRLGCAVMEAAWVASGRADYALLIGARPWDIAAGTLLVREAGGLAVKPDGDDWTIKDADVLLVGTGLSKSELKRLKLA